MKKSKILIKLILSGMTIFVILGGLIFMGSAIYKSVTKVKIPSNKKDALALFEKECKNNDHIDYCFEAAIYHLKGVGTIADSNKAVVYFKKACDLGDKEGCQKAALFGNINALERDIGNKSMDQMTPEDKKRLGEVFGDVLKNYKGK